MRPCSMLFNFIEMKYYILLFFMFLQDVNDRWSLEIPQLYVPGQLSQYFSKRAFMMCALHSCYSSLVLFFVPYAAIYDTARDDGRDGADSQSFALITQTCLTVTVCVQVSLTLRCGCLRVIHLIGWFIFTNFSSFLLYLPYSWGWTSHTGLLLTISTFGEV